MSEARYVQPGWFTRNVFNRAVQRLTKLGLSVYGSRELRVQGRKSGEWRTTPVNPLVVDGQRYLVSPRGITQWARNLRVASRGELRVGRRIEAFEASELVDDVKPPILREYVRRYKFEVGAFFKGIDGKSSDEDLLAIAGDFPVFRIVSASGPR